MRKIITMTISCDEDDVENIIEETKADIECMDGGAKVAIVSVETIEDGRPMCASYSICGSTDRYFCSDCGNYEPPAT